MNIPEITNEVKQVARSENVHPAQSVERPYSRDGSVRAAPDAVQKQNALNKENQNPREFSREEMNSFIKDAEEQLEAKDIQLKFNILEEDDTIQVEIVDAEGKTIRKIPGDELVKLSQSLKSLERGFIDKVS
ncbi:flagellar protein FlaG [Pseudodesulfovibrio sp. zrk46]|uniref:flagellar protein FlaG n=1 Tax=Pseudodesulfovibrio sp. zrk46 TaxID=2725288 RepID=UPI00144A0A56|nr:flagellar protein FlaG [Pseudodesulfovibrio sp. zrk46]QJB57755.1 flagellar protein FlaG [Pseudodesulfovibrio sp. zrk46]